jgi:hypothetical protein
MCDLAVEVTESSSWRQFCSGSLIPDTDLDGTVTTADEVFYDKTTSIVFS